MTSPAQQDTPIGDWHETLVRVRYSETDKDMEAHDDAFLVVAESYCRYKAPAFYDDELLIRTHITEMRRRSLRFGYEIIRASDGQIIAEGETGHVVTDSDGRVRSFPEGYAQRLLAPPIVKTTPTTGEIVPEKEGPE